jgi:chromosome segregation ATPase
LEETLTQLQDLKTLNHEILDLLESEKEQHRAVLGELQLVKEQLAAEKGSHAFTLEQLANEQMNLEHAQQFTEGLKADLERAQQQLADTLTLQNEKIEELHATISTLRSQKDALQHQLRELHTENGRLSRERGDSDASIAALTKHIRELKSAPASTLSHSSSTSVLEAALTKEREEHAATRKQLSDHKKTAHTYLPPAS